MVADFYSILEWYPYVLETEWSTCIFMSLYTDAASSIGWTAYWCADGYKPAGHQKNIKWIQYGKSFLLGTPLGTQKVLFHCHNRGYLENRNHQISRYYGPSLHAIFSCRWYNIIITHFAGINNTISDTLSKYLHH